MSDTQVASDNDFAGAVKVANGRHGDQIGRRSGIDEYAVRTPSH